MIHPSNNERLVFRQVAFPVSVFDYLKEVQRRIERQTGQHLNNNQVLARILAEHQQQSNVESEEQNEQTRSAART